MEELLEAEPEIREAGTSQALEIGVCSLRDLLELPQLLELHIPAYQRPYVWDIEKIATLFKDLEEYYKERKAGEYYYFGTVLLHRKSETKLDIIDGQQRLTTLLILDYEVNKENSLLATHNGRLHLNFNSPKSKQNILKNQEYVSVKLKESPLNGKMKVFLADLIATVIITPSEDEAFTFFDTQNNRGVKLSAVDYLKSYHLKALKGDSDEIGRQRTAAQNWDLANQDQRLNHLFGKFIWRVRNWKGKETNFEKDPLILEEFQKKTRAKRTDQAISLFPNSKNQLAETLEFSATTGVQIRTAPISLQTKPLDYPFSLRQPLEKGMGFFLYTQKYSDLYRYIFSRHHEENSELWLLNDFYQKVYDASGFSAYLTDFFKLCSLLYFDKFGRNQLFCFALWLDYLLGAIRINQGSILAQTPLKILREKNQNLLDIIETAFLPEEVFEFIKANTESAYYKNVVSGKGVQGRYKNCLLNYYKQPDNAVLTDKISWINAKLETK